MINIFLFIAIFIFIFIISTINYYFNYSKLVIYHPYSQTIDVLAFIGTIILIIIGFIYHGTIQKYDYLIWIQIIFAISVFNIHASRFVVGIIRKNK
jgi:hypothetical protein